MQRKRYSQEFKDQIVEESLEVGNAAIVARKNDLSANMVSRWVRDKFMAGWLAAIIYLKY